MSGISGSLVRGSLAGRSETSAALLLFFRFFDGSELIAFKPLSIAAAFSAASRWPILRRDALVEVCGGFVVSGGSAGPFAGEGSSVRGASSDGIEGSSVFSVSIFDPGNSSMSASLMRVVEEIDPTLPCSSLSVTFVKPDCPPIAEVEGEGEVPESVPEKGGS
jgi:hypothetical protein